MSKRKFEEDTAMDVIMGYIHDVSELKRAKNNTMYFDGTIQTAREEKKRLVSFSVDKHDKFKTAVKLQSPVKLSKVTMSPNRGEIEVLVNKRSRLECVNCVPFKKSLFKDGQPGYCDLSSLTIPRQRVSVKVKILATLEERGLADCFGAQVEKMEVLVGDHSLQMPLTLWGKHIDKVEKGHSYSLKNISTRMYAGIMKLTTTPKTEIEEIGNVTVTKKNFQEQTLEKITTKLEFVSTICSIKCRVCNRPIDEELIGKADEDGLLTECPHCNMMQTNKKLKSSMLVRVNIDQGDGQKKFTAFESTIREFLQESDNVALLNSPKEVTKFLINHPEVQLECSKDVIMKMTAVTVVAPVEDDDHHHGDDEHDSLPALDSPQGTSSNV